MRTFNFEEGKYLADVLKYDIQQYSRDEISIKTGSKKLEIGTVLGKNSAGEYKPLDTSATTGEQIAAAVLITEVDAAEDTSVSINAVIVSRHASIVESGLEWPEGITEEQKAEALSELSAIGIITRREA